MSVLPVIGIGLLIGFIGAVMGIGGGFLLVPLLIYVLRVPTSTVIGTSMVLTLVTMASATVMHAVTNHLVDAVPRADPDDRRRHRRAVRRLRRTAHRRRAAAASARPPGARGRHPLRSTWWCRRPRSTPSARRGRRHDRARASLAFALMMAGLIANLWRRGSAERLIVSLSNHRVSITPYYTGEELVLFGNVERDAGHAARCGRLMTSSSP